jgi:hypothetical protein
MRDKSAAESKSLNLMDKLSVVEAEKEELGRRLAAEREGLRGGLGSARRSETCARRG